MDIRGVGRMKTDTYYIQFGRRFNYLNKEWLLDLPVELNNWTQHDTEERILLFLEEAVEKIKKDLEWFMEEADEEE
tara:strand:- start:711 stop:938 length:228 start_codon:yes stop_codon:yes gene_type:complete